MASIFYVDCPRCKTHIRVEEVGTRFPARSCDPIYCPVCEGIVVHKNTMYDFEEYVDSLESTIEPYKSEYLKKQLK